LEEALIPLLSGLPVANPWPCPLAIGVLAGVASLGCATAGSGPAVAPDSPVPSDRPLVGGPCRYSSHPGKARVVSVVPQVDDQGQQRYDVKFEFLTREQIAESFAQPEGRTFPLLVNGSRPDRAFLTKHKIRRGRVLPCTMKVIVKGTCSPVVFEFAFDETVDDLGGSTQRPANGSEFGGR
jgi:hypothetical protein